MKLLLKWPWHNQIAAMTLHQKIGFKFKPHCPKSRRQICDRSAMEEKKKKNSVVRRYLFWIVAALK
jgi:hypothetical protein